jgi:tetratricopeptide (TPR) repeat protein
MAGMIAAAMAHGDLHEAIDAVSQVIAQRPDDAALFLRRAELHRMHEDWAAAEADYAQARRLKPDMEVVSFGLAQMRLAQGREKDALDLLDHFLVKRPDHAGGHALRADLLEKRGEWKKADTDLAAAVASSPEPHYATARAALLERHGRADAAARCLDEASRARGRVPVLEQQALEIEERAGFTNAAMRRLDDLVAREPRPDIWLARKARLLEKAGRAAEARAAWEQAATAFQRVPAEKRESNTNRKLASEIEAGRAGAPANAP